MAEAGTEALAGAVAKAEAGAEGEQTSMELA